MSNRFCIVKKFPIFAVISLILMAPGLIGLLALPFGFNFFNMDVDFVGGTSMTFDIHQEVTSELSGSVIPELVEEAAGVAPSSVQKTGDNGEQVLIKSTKLDSEQQNAVVEAMQTEFGITDDDTQTTAILAAFAAVVLMLIYISFRFELTSGLAAITGLLHDLLIVLSAYLVFRIPFNTTFIAVALTILGYSINASIIVFDRVRENRKYARRELFEDTVEKSLWQTAGRTLNTSITTLLSVGVIFVMGVTSLRQFTLPIIVGIVAGAYSSLFLAGTLWVKYRNLFRKNKREKAQEKARAQRAVPAAESAALAQPQEAKAETPAQAQPDRQPQKVAPKKVSKKKRKKHKNG